MHRLNDGRGITNRCTEAAGGAAFEGRAFWRRLGDLGRSLACDSMATELPIDDDRTAWDAAWRERPLRRLVDPVQIDVSPTPGDDCGDITRVDIAVDPPQYESSGWRKDDICPVCGRSTTDESSRLAVTIYPYFSKGFSYGLSAWAHELCFASCEEVPGPAPVPW